MMDDTDDAYIIAKYLADAVSGRDEDWVRQDSNVTESTLLLVAALMGSPLSDGDKVSEVSALIHLVQLRAAHAHLEALKSND